MNNKVKINYNETFGTTHSRDYYRGASFRWSGEWMVGAHYFSDDYNVDFVVHDQVILACAKSHMASLENEPKDFLFNENGDVIGVVSEYWDFVLSGVKGKTPGIKIEDNYWWTCSDITDPIWVNTGVKAKMELSDLTPEEIALLQEPGLEVVTHFIDDVITQSLGQDTEKVPSQKLITDELANRVTKGEMSAAFINAKQTYDLTYQPIGDYATNTRVGQVESALDDAVDRISVNEGNISSLSDDLSDEVLSRQTEDATLLGKIQTEITNRQNGDYANAQYISEINAKIPSEASSSNQLADKNFVHNEVSTSSATFKGTYNTLVELEAQSADNNDYGFVVHTDALGNTIYSRYKYNGTEWLWEYDITSTEFSQSQWEAVNSGINSTLVTKLSDLPTNADLTTALNNKVDKVTGKGLSTNDYTTAEKTKLSNIEANAQVNVLEGVKVDGIELPITEKKVNIDLSGKVNVASHQSQTDQSFVFRQTGGGNLTIDAKNSELTSIKGKTLVWNSLFKIKNDAAGTYNGVTVTIDNNRINVVGTNNEGNTGVQISIANSIVAPGHKWLFKMFASEWKEQITNLYVQKTGTGANIYLMGVEKTITTIPSNWSGGSWYIVLPIINGKTYNFSFIPQIYDLTQMFGPGNEPSTVEEFEALFPLPYYEYNAGTLISNDAVQVETTGFNQWDEETARGYWNGVTGDTITFVSGTMISNKNPIPVLPNTAYRFTSPSMGQPAGAAGYFNARFTDADGVILSRNMNCLNNVITSPVGAVYLYWNISEAYGTTYNHDICINLSDPAKNGTYEPYENHVLPLGLNSFRVTDGTNIITVNGLKSAGSVYDEIDLVRNKYIKRIGEVDMGTLVWGYYQSYNIFTSSATSVILNGQKTSVICAKYVNGYYTGNADKVIRLEANGALRVKDTQYGTDVAAFKAAMSGVMLYYELATPIEYDLVEPIRTDYPVDKLGTERVISDTVPTPPFLADITYHEANIKDIEIEGITDYVKREELTDELDKLGTIEDGAQVNKIEHIQINGTEQTITNKTVNLPAYPTTLPASDVYDWAKASTKPSYNFSEIGGTVADSQLPDTISSDITGTAMGLKTEKLTGQEFVYRATPNTIKAKSLGLDRIYGKTLVWNQLISLPASFDYGGVTFTNNGDGSLTLNGTANRSIDQVIARINTISGHKYLIKFKDIDDGAPCTLVIGSNSFTPFVELASKVIRECIGSVADQSIRIAMSSGTVLNNVRTIPQIFDLTLIFGTGNEPATVEEFEALFPNPHYAYNAGTLISNDAESIETVGFNQWDEEWERGRIDVNTGNNLDNVNGIRSKGYIRVLPDTEYFIQLLTSYTWLMMFDEEYNLLPISSWSGGTYTSGNARSVSRAVFKTPKNGAYMRFYTLDTYGNVYNHDICINISDTAKNGTYEQYKEEIININLDQFDVRDSEGNVTTITGGLKQAGSVFDEIKNGKYYKRVGSVDLGTLDWSRFVNNIFAATISNYNNNKYGLICSRYLTDKSANGWADLTNKCCVGRGSEQIVYFNDETYSDSATFKEAMSGVILYYELAQKEVYDLVEPLVMTMPAGTTERRLPEDTASSVIAPFCADITYSIIPNSTSDILVLNDRVNTKYEKPSGGIPKTDFDSDVQESLGKADTAIQDISGKLDVPSIEEQVDQLFRTRQTGDELDFDCEYARLTSVKGNSVKFNQLVQNGDFSDALNHWYTREAVATIEADGSVKVDVSSTYNGLYLIEDEIVPGVVGHKYFMHALIKTSSTKCKLYCYQTPSYIQPSPDSFSFRDNIITLESANKAVGIQLDEPGTVYVKNIILIDLTILGIDNLTTPEEVEAWLVENWGESEYYPYNPGSVLNVNITGLESTGEDTIDIIDTTNLDVTHIYGKKNGTGSLVQVWPTGMPGLGDLKDCLRVENGQVVARRVMGEVDFGTLTWNTYDSTAGKIFRAQYQVPSNNILCAKYVTKKQEERVEKCIYRNNANGRVDVIDSSYTDTEAFKAAMSGVMLYYELETPEIYTDLVYQGSDHFADGIPVILPLDYKVDRLGTERVLSDATYGSLICANIDYYQSSIDYNHIKGIGNFVKQGEFSEVLADYTTLDSLKSKGSSSAPVYFDSNGEPQAIIGLSLDGELSGNAFKVIAEHIAKLTSRVEALEAGAGTVDTLSSTSVDSANGYYINGDKTVLSGAGAPSMVPGFIGQFYVDTTNKKLYVATGNSSSSNWTLLN